MRAFHSLAILLYFYFDVGMRPANGALVTGVDKEVEVKVEEVEEEPKVVNRKPVRRKQARTHLFFIH